MNSGIAVLVCSGAALLVANGVATAGQPDVESRLRDLDARVSRAERLLNSQALLDMYRRQEDLQKEVQGLRGENERMAHELEMFKDRQRDLYLDIDRRLRRGGSSGASPARSPSESRSDSRAASTSAVAPPVIGSSDQGAVPRTQVPSSSVVAPVPMAKAEDEQAYGAAFEILREGRYEQAIESFARFLRTYPESLYAANAQYWQGEACYVIGNYPAARASFERVVKDYPGSDKVPDARLKLGFSYEELGQWKEARRALESVRDEYPNTTVARLAAEHLHRMSREGH